MQDRNEGDDRIVRQRIAQGHRARRCQIEDKAIGERLDRFVLVVRLGVPASGAHGYRKFTAMIVTIVTDITRGIGFTLQFVLGPHEASLDLELATGAERHKDTAVGDLLWIEQIWAVVEPVEYLSWSRAVRQPIPAFAQQGVCKNDDAPHDGGNGNFLGFSDLK